MANIQYGKRDQCQFIISHIFDSERCYDGSEIIKPNNISTMENPEDEVPSTISSVSSTMSSSTMSSTNQNQNQNQVLLKQHEAPHIFSGERDEKEEDEMMVVDEIKFDKSEEKVINQPSHNLPPSSHQPPPTHNLSSYDQPPPSHNLPPSHNQPPSSHHQPSHNFPPSSHNQPIEEEEEEEDIDDFTEDEMGDEMVDHEMVDHEVRKEEMVDHEMVDDDLEDMSEEEEEEDQKMVEEEEEVEVVDLSPLISKISLTNRQKLTTQGLLDVLSSMVKVWDGERERDVLLMEVGSLFTSTRMKTAQDDQSTNNNNNNKKSHKKKKKKKKRRGRGGNNNNNSSNHNKNEKEEEETDDGDSSSSVSDEERVRVVWVFCCYLMVKALNHPSNPISPSQLNLFCGNGLSRKSTEVRLISYFS